MQAVNEILLLWGFNVYEYIHAYYRQLTPHKRVQAWTESQHKRVKRFNPCPPDSPAFVSPLPLIRFISVKGRYTLTSHLSSETDVQPALRYAGHTQVQLGMPSTFKRLFVGNPESSS